MKIVTSVPPLTVVTTWCYLLSIFRTPQKPPFVFDHPEFTCRPLVAPMPKLLEQRYDFRFVVIPCEEFMIPPTSFHPILARILHLEAVDLDVQAELRLSYADTIVMVLGCVGVWLVHARMLFGVSFLGSWGVAVSWAGEEVVQSFSLRHTTVERYLETGIKQK